MQRILENMKKNETGREIESPYYAVIFSSRRSSEEVGYTETAERMMALAFEQPGFLGIESLRNGKTGLTISYWRDEASISAWKNHFEHLAAQDR